MTWKLRIVHYENADPKTLQFNPLNMRLHPASQQFALDTLLQEVGWVRDVIVNERTGFLIDGHLRVARAIADGQKEIPVAYVDLSEEEERLALSLFDYLTSMAYADEAALRSLLAKTAIASQRVSDLLVILRQHAGLEPPSSVVDPIDDVDGDKPLPDVQATVGSFTFTIPRAVFLKWRESLYQKVGFKTVDITQEVRERLGL